MIYVYVFMYVYEGMKEWKKEQKKYEHQMASFLKNNNSIFVLIKINNIFF